MEKRAKKTNFTISKIPLVIENGRSTPNVPATGAPVMKVDGGDAITGKKNVGPVVAPAPTDVPSVPPMNDPGPQADSDFMGIKGLKLNDIIPWLAALGTGAAAHAAMSSVSDDVMGPDRRRSIWYRLLGALLPIAAGGLGAYGGYRLGNMLLEKKSMDKSAAGSQASGPDDKPRKVIDWAEFDRGGGIGTEGAPVEMMPRIDEILDWGRKHFRGDSYPTEDVIDYYGDWKGLEGRTALLGGMAGRYAPWYFGARGLFNDWNLFKDATPPTEQQVADAREALNRHYNSPGEPEIRANEAEISRINDALENGRPLASDSGLSTAEATASRSRYALMERLEGQSLSRLAELERQLNDPALNDNARGAIRDAHRAEVANLRNIRGRMGASADGILRHEVDATTISPELRAEYLRRVHELRGINSAARRLSPSELKSAQKTVDYRPGRSFNMEGLGKSLGKNTLYGVGSWLLGNYLDNLATELSEESADADNLLSSLKEARRFREGQMKALANSSTNSVSSAQQP